MAYPKLKSKFSQTKLLNLALSQRLVVVIICIAIFYLLRFWLTGMTNSLQKNTYLLSVANNDNLVLSVEDKNNLYFSFFPQPSLVVQVPGGYGEYSFEGMILLSKNENKPEIAKNSASWVVGGWVDYYFILHENPLGLKLRNGAQFPLRYMLTPPAFVSTNMNLVQRLKFWYQTRKVSVKDYIVIKSNYSKADENDSDKKKFAQNQYSENYEGFYFLSLLRSENLRLRLSFFENQSGAKLGRILRGVGLKLVDMQVNPKISEACNFKLAPNLKVSQAKYTIEFLKKINKECILLPEKTEGVDLEINFGASTEAKWK